MYATAEQIQQLHIDACLIHGDCWYYNTVQTPTKDVILIDWDRAGRGLAFLDVGYLLLTSHYDLTQPFCVHADVQKICAILGGYQRQRQLTAVERAHLLDAIRFALAVHFGEYIDQQHDLQAADTVLEKFQARFDATAEIASLAQTVCI